MLEARLKGEPPREDVWDGVAEAIRDECEYTYEKYCQFYPVESWETVDVERLLEVPIVERLDVPVERVARDGADCASMSAGDDNTSGSNDPDVYVAKLDWVARSPEGLRIIDHKTEERGSLNNSLQRWQYLTQVSLYQWAAAQVYQEPIYGLTIDVITRRSPKGQVDPEFRRVEVFRSDWQQRQAVETLKYVTAQIKNMRSQKWEDNLWPQNRENCHKWRMPCAYAAIHGESGRDQILLDNLYGPAEKYLEKTEKAQEGSLYNV